MSVFWNVMNGTELSTVSVEPAFSTFPPLRCWQHIFLNRCYLSTTLYGVLFHQAELLTFNAAKTPSNLEKICDVCPTYFTLKRGEGGPISMNPLPEFLSS